MIENSKILEKLKSDNFILLKNKIDKNLLKKILVNVQAAKKKIKNKRDIHYIKTKKGKKLSSLHNIHLYSKFYKNFILNSGLNRVIEKIYGSSSKKIFNSSYFIKPSKVGIETKMHQDNAYFNLKKGQALTCWIPLDKTNKKNSCLYYYRNSSKLGNLRHLASGNPGASMSIHRDERFIKKIKKFKKVFVKADFGDCIIHDAFVVHGSSVNSSVFERRAFNFSIKSKCDIRDKKKFFDYKNKLRKFLNKIN